MGKVKSRRKRGEKRRESDVKGKERRDGQSEDHERDDKV